MKPAVAGLLSLLIVGILYFAGCSSETGVAQYYQDLDSVAFLKKLDQDHFTIREQLLKDLSEFLKIRASGNSDRELYQQLDWLIRSYYDATGLRDLSYRLSLYEAWDKGQAQEILSLREYRAKLQKGRDSLSLPVMRDELERLGHLFESLNDSIYLAVIAKDLAQIYEAQDKIDSAIYFYRLCISISRLLDEYSLKGNGEMLLGRLYNYRLADYLQSERAYSDAIRSFRRVGDERLIPFVQLGRVYDFLQLYQTETSIEIIRDILPELKSRLDRSNEAYCYYFLSVAYNNLGLLDSALYFGKKSIVLRRDLVSRSLSGVSDLGYSMSQLGLIHQNLGHHEQALEYYRAADSIFALAHDPAGAAVNLIGWGNHFIETKAFDSARIKFEKISSDNISFENFVCSRYGLALCEYYQGNIDRAITELKNCIWLVEHANRKLPIPELKTGILSDKIGIYNLLSVIYFNLFRSTAYEGYADSAFFYLERSKSRALIDNFVQDTRINPEGAENRYLRRLAEIHKVGRTSGGSETITKAIRDLEDSLLFLYVESSEETSDDIRNLSDAFIDIAAVQKELPDNKTILLEYLLSHFGSFVFVIGKGAYTVREISGDYDSLQHLINHHLDAISTYPDNDNPHDDYRESGKELYSILIPEIELAKVGTERLIIAASGPLHYLPLESLIDESNRFLVEKFDVSYVPSAMILRFISTNEAAPDTPAVVAFASSPASIIDEGTLKTFHDGYSNRPYWAVDHLAPLPFCSVEARAIADCFDPHKTEIYLGDKATEANFKNIDFPQFDYLHLAAHGLTDDRRPDRSAIILSMVGDEENDGLLRPREIAQLNIPVRMVFLSSCRSGRGKSFPGEGILNIARPFLIAGCRSAVVTHWSIKDLSTADFAESFYRHLLSGQSQTQALALTKRQYIYSHRPQYRHPYFWAPFILIGS